MAGVPNFFDMSRFSSNTGGIVGATVYFYASGTTNLAPIYNDIALTSPMANPVVVAQGAVTPSIYLDSTIKYRRYILFSDGTVSDRDPVPVADSTVGSSVYASRASLASSSVSPGSRRFMAEPGREGDFECFAGTPPFSDPYQGLLISSTTPGYYWRRVCDGISAKPEWWGFFSNRPDLPGNDCLTQAETVAKAAGFRELAYINDDYYINTTHNFKTSAFAHRGVPGRRFQRGQGTCLLVQSATADVMLMGLTAYPGAINSFAADQVVRGMGFSRTVVPAPGTLSAGSVTGLRVNYTLNSIVEECFSSESTLGYSIGGVVYTIFRRCRAFRASPLVGSNDAFVGWWFDGLPNIGLAGGNASVYADECATESALAVTLSNVVTGAAFNGSFVDTFVNYFETTNCRKGLDLAGTGSSGGPYTNIDLTIFRPVLDACWEKGIEITGVSPGGIVEIVSPYSALTSTRPSAGASSRGFACLHLHDTAGTIRIVSGQSHCGPDSTNAGTSLGVLAQNTSGIEIYGHLVTDSTRPYGFIDSKSFTCYAKAENVAVSTVQGALYVQGTTSGKSTQGDIRLTIQGKTPLFLRGVELSGSLNTRMTVDQTKIDDASISGGSSANRVWSNGASVGTTNGSFSWGALTGS